MSTVPNRYQPAQRLIDNPDELRRLYHDEDKTIREIVTEDATVGRTRVNQALHEYGIIDDESTDNNSGSVSVDLSWTATQ